MTPRAGVSRGVLAGFATKPRSLPCRFFYDARGSALFEEITQLEEYYPTRVETALLEAMARRSPCAWAPPACWWSSARDRAARRACC